MEGTSQVRGGDLRPKAPERSAMRAARSEGIGFRVWRRKRRNRKARIAVIIKNRTEPRRKIPNSKFQMTNKFKFTKGKLETKYKGDVDADSADSAGFVR